MLSHEQRKSNFQKTDEKESYSGLQDELIGPLFHDFRNGLTAISSLAGVSAMMLESGKKDKLLLKRLRQIENEAVHLSKLVEHVWMTYRQGFVETAFKEVSVRKLFENAELICSPVCKESKNRIIKQCKADVTVFCEKYLMVQVLANLVINACAHMKNGEILMKGEKTGNDTVITVVDHGDGIDTTIMEHVFDLGVSGSKSTGYGLYICKRIIDRHGGQIRLFNNNDGGTTAEIILYGGSEKHD